MNSPIKIRRATPSDVEAAGLVFDAAATEYAALAGSRTRARAVLKRLWAIPNHSASFQFAWLAEFDGRPVGCLVAFPAHRRLRLHASLLQRSISQVPPRRLAILAAGLFYLWRRTPKPPDDALYVGSLAIAPQFRRQGVASALGEAVQEFAREMGLARVAAHTGASHWGARRALEKNGCVAVDPRTDGYVLYVKDL